MNIKTRTWIISTVAIVAATAALAGFVAMVKPVDPTDSSPSLRQQVMAKKVAQIAKARQLTTQVNARSAPSREPVAADDTGIGTTLGIVGTCTVVLVVVSLGTLAAWDRLQTARRKRAEEREALLAKLAETLRQECEPAALVVSLTETQAQTEIERRLGERGAVRAIQALDAA